MNTCYLRAELNKNDAKIVIFNVLSLDGENRLWVKVISLTLAHSWYKIKCLISIFYHTSFRFIECWIHQFGRLKAKVYI